MLPNKQDKVAENTDSMVGEELFDLTEDYEAMLNQGIRLSGENMFFFLEGRLKLLREKTVGRRKVSRILDFGCGLGYASKRLHDLFPGAEITGVDTSEKALEHARERNTSPRIRFQTVRELACDTSHYDLCYVNGVFHHIPPPERPGALALIYGRLGREGALALFENNPWNFGTRMVMARIPFDRDAVMLSPLHTADLLRKSGFEVARTDSLFFFPRSLKVMRPAERILSWTRLGAQYVVFGVKR